MIYKEEGINGPRNEAALARVDRERLETALLSLCELLDGRQVHGTYAVDALIDVLVGLGCNIADPEEEAE